MFKVQYLSWIVMTYFQKAFPSKTSVEEQSIRAVLQEPVICMYMVPMHAHFQREYTVSHGAVPVWELKTQIQSAVVHVNKVQEQISQARRQSNKRIDVITAAGS